MIGSQLNFFLLGEDEKKVYEVLFGDSNFIAISSISQSPDIEYLNVEKEKWNFNTKFGILFCRRQDIKLIVTKPPTSIGMHYIDKEKSPVVEYLMCRQILREKAKPKIQMGRMGNHDETFQ